MEPIGDTHFRCENPLCKDCLTEYEMNILMKPVQLRPLGKIPKVKQ